MNYLHTRLAHLEQGVQVCTVLVWDKGGLPGWVNEAHTSV